MRDLERPILDFIHAMAASTDLMQHPALVVAGKTILLQQADQARQVLFKGNFVSIPRVCEQGAQQQSEQPKGKQSRGKPARQEVATIEIAFAGWLKRTSLKQEPLRLPEGKVNQIQELANGWPLRWQGCSIKFGFRATGTDSLVDDGNGFRVCYCLRVTIKH